MEIDKQKLNSSDLTLIKLFKTEQENYCYVSHTNSLLQIGVDEWVALHHDQKQRILSKEGNKILSEIFRVAELKFFGAPQKAKFPLLKNEIIENLENGLTSLLLNTTESCNLACDYCIYSGSYIGSRGPSIKFMKKDVAFRAIDFFLTRTTHTEAPIISFYGGEPLLRFGFIQECIKYAANRSSKDLVFSFTTNGTLLDIEKVKFLKKYNVSIVVSIDGPDTIHDKHRHTRENKGSHHKIVSNLRVIKDKLPDFYKNNISFISVITPDSDIPAIDKYFSENELFNQNRFIVTSVRTSGSSKFKPFNFVTDEISDAYIKYKSNSKRKENVFLKGIFEKSLVRFHERKLWEGYPTYIYPNGICLPGARKLFVTCDGEFKTCERVATSKTIGNIYNGFDLNAIYTFIKEYEDLCNPDCTHCWANRLCTMCFSSIYVENIDPELKKQKCDRLRKRFLNDILRYCKIMEKNQDAFN